MDEESNTAVSEWLSRTTDEDRRVVLEALQISIVASRESAMLTGVLPRIPQPYLLCNVHRHDDVQVAGSRDRLQKARAGRASDL